MELMIKLIRISYSLLLYLLIPLVIIRLLLRSLKLPAYRHRISERFGFGSSLISHKKTLWIHAVSLGEAQAALLIVNAVREKNDWSQILLTTTTTTGAELVQAAINNNPNLIHRYAPYDLPDAINRFIKRTQPNLLIIIETELWPNLIHACHKRNIPVIIGNARLSARSMRGYQYFSLLIKTTLQEVTAIAAQSQADAERFKRLGACPERLWVTGNIKFDLMLPNNRQEQFLSLKQNFNLQRPIWIAASTHHGEEEIILAAHVTLRQTIKNALLILVPRHPERFIQVTKLSVKNGFSTRSWSEHSVVPDSCAVYIGDTTGWLTIFYGLAKLAFIGGSLVPVGGHNPLEAAVFGMPIIFGTHRFNFTEITQILLDAHAAFEVQDQDTFAAKLLELFNNDNLCYTVGKNALQVLENNRGALTKLMKIVAAVNLSACI